MTKLFALCGMYAPYIMENVAAREGETDLPPLPPVSHAELGRQEPLGFAFSDRRRDPFAGATNNVVAFDRPAPPLTVEGLAALMEKVVDELGPLPPLYPWLDADLVFTMKPPTPGLSERGIAIYWTDSRGQTWGPHGRVG